MNSEKATPPVNKVHNYAVRGMRSVQFLYLPYRAVPGVIPDLIHLLYLQCRAALGRPANGGMLGKVLEPKSPELFADLLLRGIAMN
jgi:hypothetical protein